ncbi:hypothetical protein VHEMI07710 [[Torrubiella] hemipterigena]|uniref:Uncharacterized protein n=1 Tax=[Torrubiella] hemipterigena TaxID=1531966 RepID=A0A0A1TLV1_9HYPO|nr:hypothetical protein VHEMI07710 [[Torrubiella] hemipterigena]
MVPPLPIFSPLPIDPCYAAYPDDDARYQHENRRISWKSLALLADSTFNTYIPYGWGFTVYRVRFDGDSDERFQSALDRFDLWLRCLVRAVRYGDDNVRDNFTGPNDSTDQIAERLYNQVFEFDPASLPDDTVITEPEGDEDFFPVGAAFSEWVASLDVDLAASRGNARYHQCLIVDKTALVTLEKLPAEVPPLHHYETNNEHSRSLFSTYNNAWVWVLDRQSNERLAAGENVDFSPWLRVRLPTIEALWFERPKGNLWRLDWRQLTQEDRHKWETVAWWHPQALIINGVTRQVRESRAKRKDQGILTL